MTNIKAIFKKFTAAAFAATVATTAAAQANSLNPPPTSEQAATTTSAELPSPYTGMSAKAITGFGGFIQRFYVNSWEGYLDRQNNKEGEFADIMSQCRSLEFPCSKNTHIWAKFVEAVQQLPQGTSDYHKITLVNGFVNRMIVYDMQKGTIGSVLKSGLSSAGKDWIKTTYDMLKADIPVGTCGDIAAITYQTLRHLGIAAEVVGGQSKNLGFHYIVTAKADGIQYALDTYADTTANDQQILINGLPVEANTHAVGFTLREDEGQRRLAGFKPMFVFGEDNNGKPYTRTLEGTVQSNNSIVSVDASNNKAISNVPEGIRAQYFDYLSKLNGYAIALRAPPSPLYAQTISMPTVAELAPVRALAATEVFISQKKPMPVPQ